MSRILSPLEQRWLRSILHMPTERRIAELAKASGMTEEQVCGQLVRLWMDEQHGYEPQRLDAPVLEGVYFHDGLLFRERAEEIYAAAGKGSSEP